MGSIILRSSPADVLSREPAGRVSHCVCSAGSRGPVGQRDRGVPVNTGSDRTVAHVPCTGDAARVVSARARHGNRRRLPLRRRALRSRRRGCSRALPRARGRGFLSCVGTRQRQLGQIAAVLGNAVERLIGACRVATIRKSPAGESEKAAGPSAFRPPTVPQSVS